MKEVRYFYVPDATRLSELPEEEALHAIRVLRLKEGDEMMLMDGCGTFYEAVVTMVASRRCCYRIVQPLPQERQWAGHLHIAVAPTKMMERMEWFLEKATEVGIDECTFLSCQFSERKVIKVPRLERIVIAAVKQSRKAWMPQVQEMTDFRSFIASHTSGHRFIAHCYDEVARSSLFDELQRLSLPSDAQEEVLVLVGPEGDFSIEEVRLAVAAGFTSVHLGTSRLRTETAALSAVMMMQLACQS